MKLNRLFVSAALPLTLALSAGALTSVPARAAQPEHTMSHEADAGNHHAAGATENSPLYTTKGTVVEVDATGKKITVAHEAIPALNWPAMTMRFSVEQPDLLEGVKAGSSIRFDFLNQGKESILKDLEILR